MSRPVDRRFLCALLTVVASTIASPASAALAKQPVPGGGTVLAQYDARVDRIDALAAEGGTIAWTVAHRSGRKVVGRTIVQVEGRRRTFPGLIQPQDGGKVESASLAFRPLTTDGGERRTALWLYGCTRRTDCNGWELDPRTGARTPWPEPPSSADVAEVTAAGPLGLLRLSRTRSPDGTYPVQLEHDGVVRQLPPVPAAGDRTSITMRGSLAFVTGYLAGDWSSETQVLVADLSIPTPVWMRASLSGDYRANSTRVLLGPDNGAHLWGAKSWVSVDGDGTPTGRGLDSIFTLDLTQLRTTPAPVPPAGGVVYTDAIPTMTPTAVPLPKGLRHAIDQIAVGGSTVAVTLRGTVRSKERGKRATAVPFVQVATLPNTVLGAAAPTVGNRSRSTGP